MCCFFYENMLFLSSQKAEEPENPKKSKDVLKKQQIYEKTGFCGGVGMYGFGIFILW